MNTKKYVLIFLLIFGLTAFVSAQSGDNSSRSNRDKKQLLDLSFFLPVKPSSWTVSLVSSGGILGETRLLISLNSNGNVMCSANEITFQNRFAPKTDFEAVSQIINSELSAFSFRSEKTIRKHNPYCSDCSYQTVAIDYRGEKSITTEYFAVENFNSTQSRIQDIYKIINELDTCN